MTLRYSPCVHMPTLLVDMKDQQKDNLKYYAHMYVSDDVLIGRVSIE